MRPDDQSVASQANAADGCTSRKGAEMPSSTWPWTPSSGLVAGQTFKNNHDYRIALEEAARARSRMWRAESQLTAALKAMDKSAGIYWAIRIQGWLADLIVSMARGLGEAD